MAKQRNNSGRRTVQRLPKGRNGSLNRAELNQLIDLLNERGEILNGVIREQEIQFQRIAQIQADLDLLKRARTKF